MTKLELIKWVRQLLAKGDVELALELVSSYLQGQNEQLEQDIVLLQHSHATNQTQYEIRKVIDKSEYDLANAKLVQGLQSLLERLPDHSPNPVPMALEDVAVEALQSTRRRKWLFAVGISITAVVVVYLFWFNTRTAQPAADKTRSIATDTSFEASLPGKWEASIHKIGSNFDRGNWYKYEDANAVWAVVIHADHTMSLSGTKDTSGRSELKWYYDTGRKTLNFILADGTAFDAQVKKWSRERQDWYSVKEIGRKKEEWTWLLERMPD